MTSCLIQSGNSLVDLVSLHARACFEPVGSRKFRFGLRLRLQQFSEQDVPICQGFLRDECVAAVILEGIAESCGLRCALCGVKVTRGLNDFSKLLVCVR